MVFNFYSTDAIKNISNGTTIKYLDTETCVSLSSYNNILGAVITSNNVGNTFGIMLYKRSNGITAFYRITDSGDMSATASLHIRVFYID